MEVQVRYFVKAAIVRDWKWNHKVKQHLMINGILDLNMYPSAKHGISIIACQVSNK